MEPVKPVDSPTDARTGQRVYDELIFVLEEEWVVVKTQEPEPTSPTVGASDTKRTQFVDAQ